MEFIRGLYHIFHGDSNKNLHFPHIKHCPIFFEIKRRKKASKQLFAIHFLLATCNVCPLAIPKYFAQTRVSDYWQIIQASRSFAQLPAFVQSLNPSSPRFLSTVLRHVSLGLPLLSLPSGVHVKAILVFSFILFLSTCPISFHRLRFIC